MDGSVQQGWIREGFLAWVEAQEEPYEFDGWNPVPMNGGTINHNLISANILVALREVLNGTSCITLVQGAGIATVGNAVRYPDVLVTLAAPEGTARLVPNPVLVFEVVSPSSGRLDRIVKLREYAAVPSILCYVIVDAASDGLQVLTRDGGDAPWIATTLAMDDSFVLPPILAGTSLAAAPLAIPVAAFYAGVAFEA